MSLFTSRARLLCRFDDGHHAGLVARLGELRGRPAVIAFQAGVRAPGQQQLDGAFLPFAGGKHQRRDIRRRARIDQHAARLQVVLNTYGNIAKKPYDEETAAITSLIAELRTGYAADVSTLGINAWIDELDRNNAAFDALKKERYTQDAERTQLKMKETRVAVDQCYHEIVERINALIIVNGATAYGSFVNELNALIDAYNQMLALRKGKKDAKDDKQVDK